MGVEVSISKGWSDEMPGTDVAHHISGLSVSGIIPEVGVSGNTTLAPVGTVVSGNLPGEAVGESGPMSSEGIVTDDIGLTVTVDISPLGPGTRMSAPSV